MFARRYLRGLLSLGLTVSLMSLTCCSSPSLVAITITPTIQYFGFAPGITAQFTAIGTFAQGTHPETHQDITNQVTWKSEATGLATVSPTGLVTTTGAEYGTTAITASMNGFTGLVQASSTVEVCAPGQVLTSSGCTTPSSSGG